MSSAAISAWKIPETNITSYFLLKLLNRHHPDWNHGEDIRCLTKVPETKWISENKGFSSKIYSLKLTVNDKIYQFCVKIPSIFHLEANIIAENDEIVEGKKNF
uniref:Uncharacterized protein n=1 Tax=Panagrolaimus davidi TaxID=227884 RepID=A0A914QIJ9_9BILA